MKLERPLPKTEEEASTRLTFPCGGTLQASPMWQREALECGQPSLAAFPLPQLSPDDWGRLQTIKPSQARRSKRTELRLWTVFRDQISPTYTLNLSLLGCAFPIALEVGRRLEFYLDLEDVSQPLLLTGRVVWSKDNRSGVEFLNLGVDAELRLLKALGEKSVPASNFLPTLSCTAPPFTYSLTTRDNMVSLELCLKNWVVKYEFLLGSREGHEKGAFSGLEFVSQGEEWDEWRHHFRICLQSSKTIVGIRLTDDEGKVVFKLFGQELGFRRQPIERKGKDSS